MILSIALEGYRGEKFIPCSKELSASIWLQMLLKNAHACSEPNGMAGLKMGLPDR